MSWVASQLSAVDGEPASRGDPCLSAQATLPAPLALLQKIWMTRSEGWVEVRQGNPLGCVTAGGDREP